jgi:hypothetical protein
MNYWKMQLGERVLKVIQSKSLLPKEKFLQKFFLPVTEPHQALMANSNKVHVTQKIHIK